MRRPHVLASVLAVLCAYALLAPAPASTLRLKVRGTQYALAGEAVLLRGLVYDSYEEAPVAGVDVEVSDALTGAVVARARSGAFGEARLQLPAAAAETSAYVAAAGTALPVRFQIVRRARHDLTVTADRSVYQPGESALFTVLVRSLPDLLPVSAAQVDLELVDPKRRVVGHPKAETDAFGLAHLKVALPDADRGAWAVRACVGGQKTELAFSVERRETPELEVAASCADGPFARWGDTVPVAVRAQARGGEPSAGAVATVTAKTRAGQVVVTHEALLDDAGEARVMLALPASSPVVTHDADAERQDLELAIDVHDTLGRVTTARTGLRVQSGPLLVRAEPIDPLWVAGASNRVRVWAEAPDGHAVAARFTARAPTGGPALVPLARHDEVEELALPAQSGPQSLSVVAVHGPHAVARRFRFDNRPPPALRVRPFRAHLAAGEPLALQCVSPKEAHLRVDVYAYGRLIAMDDRAVGAGATTLAIALPDGPPGELLVQAYPADRDGVRQEMTVTRGTHAPLTVTVEPEQASYRPGQPAALLVRVGGGTDPNVPAVVSVAVHDRASAGAAPDAAPGEGTQPAASATPRLDESGTPENEAESWAWVTRWIPSCALLRDGNDASVVLLFWWLLLVALPLRLYRRARIAMKHDLPDPELSLARLRLGLALGFLGAVFFLVFVASQFYAIFNSMNVELPFFTKLLVNAGGLIDRFGIAVPVFYVIADRLLVRFARAAASRPRCVALLAALDQALLPACLATAVAAALAMFMPMLKLINGVDGGGAYSASAHAPDPRPLGVVAQDGVRRSFPSTLILEPSVRLGGDRRARVALPATDAITVYDARVDAHDLLGHVGSGSGTVRYTLPLYGTLRAPALLRAHDRAFARALVYASADTDAEVLLTTPWGEQRARVSLTRGRGRAVTFALEPPAAGLYTLKLAVTSGDRRDTSEAPLQVLDGGALVTRVLRGAPPADGPWTPAVPEGLKRETAHLRLTLRGAVTDWWDLREPQPAYAFTGDEAPQILAIHALFGTSTGQAFAQRRAESRVLAARGRAGDGSWYAALDLAAAYALDPGALPAVSFDPFPADGLVSGAGFDDPDLRPTLLAATLAEEAHLAGAGLAAARQHLLQTADGGLEGPYRAALTAGWLQAAAPSHPLLPRLLDLLAARRRTVDPAWLPECRTLSEPGDAAIETTALAVRALLVARRAPRDLAPVLRWLTLQRPVHAVARLAQARAVAYAMYGKDLQARAGHLRDVRSAAPAPELSPNSAYVVYDGPLAGAPTFTCDNLSGWVYEAEVTGEAAAEAPATTLRARFSWGAATVAPDGSLEAVMQVKNTSAYDAGPLELEVPLPAGLELSGTSPWTRNGQRANRTLESLAAGRTVTLPLSCRATAPGVFGAPPAAVTDTTSGAQVLAPPRSGPTLTVAPPPAGDSEF